MDHIEQLKKIRSDAIARIRNGQDFKMAGKLGQLIIELGETVEADTVLQELNGLDSISETSRTPPIFPPLANISAAPSAVGGSSDQTDGKALDELVAEIEEGAAQLDAIMAADTPNARTPEIDNETDNVIGPFLKSDTIIPHYTNGASHQRW